MLSSLRSLVSALVVLAAAAAATAGFTDHADALSLELQQRAADATLTKAQRAAAAKARKTLEKKSKTVDKDLALFAAAAKTIDKAFPGDTELAALEGAALAGFRGEVASELATLTSLLPGLPEGKLRTRTEASVLAVGQQLDAANGAPTASAIAKGLAKAYKTAYAARRAITGGTADAYLYAFVDDRAFQARTVITASYTPLLDLLVVEGVHIENFRRGTSRTVGFDVTVAGPGMFQLGDGITPDTLDGNVLRYERGVNATTAVHFRTDVPPPDGTGTMTVSRFDEASRVVEGTFTATLIQTDDENTPLPEGEQLTISGAFRVRFVVIQ